MRKWITSGDIIPANTLFYKLPLERHFYLTLQTLNEHFGKVPAGYKHLLGIWARYISFKLELVKMLVHIKDTLPEHFILFHVSSGELEISCDCGMPEGKLCMHAYFALRRIIGSNNIEADLSGFYWADISKLAGSKEMYLDISPRDHAITIKPQKQFGEIYRPQIGFKHFIVEKIKCNSILPPTKKQKGRRPVIGYCIVSPHRRDTVTLPILVPLWGLTDVADKRIVTFKDYLIDKPVPEEVKLSPVQQQLNKICEQMWLLESAPADYFDRVQGFAQHKELIFGLWQQAFESLLSSERNVFVEWRWLHRITTVKPTRARCHHLHLSAGKVSVSFLLTEQEDYYLLEPRVLNSDGSEMIINNDTPRFFVSSYTHLYSYLLPSVQDSDLLEQLFETDNRLTIIKRHFAEFEQKYLKRLSECYEVSFKALATKKREQYKYGVIKPVWIR
jgi:hypothetical protein